MKLNPLKVGNLTATIPVIQGGMGVAISLHKLAGAVAAAGGIGIISTAQIGFREPGFDEDPIGTNLTLWLHFNKLDLYACFSYLPSCLTSCKSRTYYSDFFFVILHFFRSFF